MSLLLSWQNPVELYDNVTSYRAEVFRGAHAIESDAVWGFHEVPDGLPDEQYSVQYVDRRGSPRITVRWEDVDSWERPANGCLIQGILRRADGGVDRGRVISVTDIQSDGMKFNRRYVSNSQGRIAFLLIPGSKVLIREDGAMKALDFCTPDKRDLGFTDLHKHGSWVDTDRRGWY